MNSNNNLRHRDGKSINFDIKKVYLNTKDILSRWIQTTQKDTDPKQISKSIANLEQEKNILNMGSLRNKSEVS